MKGEVSLSVNEPVSILMPAFNREKFIGQAIKSILDQTHQNFELILYDDGSTDSTRSIMDEALFQDDRIKVLYSDENKGVAHARNVLLDACRYSYACWQDSDDISKSHKIEIQLKYMNSYTMVFTKWLWFIDDEKGFVTRDQKFSVDQATPTLMFPVDKSVRFDENKRFGGEDWEWISRMKKLYNNEEEIDEVLYYLRFHNDRIGNLNRLMNDDERDTMTYKEAAECYGIHQEKCNTK